MVWVTYDRLLDLPGEFRYVQCRGCGLTFLSPRPDWASRRPHYAAAYLGYRRLETEASAWQRRSMKIGLRKRLGIIRRYGAGHRLLDIGCGGGDFLDWAGRHGLTAYGLERAAIMARAARRVYGPCVVEGDALRLSFTPGSFDVVTLWSALEQLADPAQGLRECARVLRPGGLLVVRTVDRESWAARLFGPDWVGLDAPRVVVAFSRPTLRRMLEQSGFEILHMGDDFHDFYPFAWSLRNWLDRHLGAPRLGACLQAATESLPSRIVSLPFFAILTWLGKNSFVTAVARAANGRALERPGGGRGYRT